MRFKPNFSANNKNNVMAHQTFLLYVITTSWLVTSAIASTQHGQQQHHQHNQQHNHHNKPQHKSNHQPSPSTPLQSCAPVREAFTHRNIGPAHMVPREPSTGAGLKHCSSAQTCCNDGMLHKYQTSIVKDYAITITSTMAPLRELLSQNIANYEAHFTQLLEISLNKTNNLFQTVYPRMASAVDPHLRSLFADFTAFLIQGDKVDVLDSLRSFFDQLFPSVYYHALNPKLTDFTDDYKECLQQARSEVHPFGEVMRRIELTVPHALTAAELFLNALRTGSDVINSTHTMTPTHECKHALLKLTYCAHCAGHTTVPPCWGMCLNVMRGCLAQMAEIDRNWNLYISALEDLIGVMKSPFNLEEVFKEFPEKISEAIMHALENGKDLDSRVRRACGQPKREKPQQTTEENKDKHHHKNHKHHRQERSVAVAPYSPAEGVPSLASKLDSFLGAVSPSKGFFGNLADTTCKDERFSGHAHQGQFCWNGVEVGAYNRSIVGVGLDKQDHNPEMKVRKHDGENSKVIASIFEKLLRIKQHMAGSQITREQALKSSSKKARGGAGRASSLASRSSRDAAPSDNYGSGYGYDGFNDDTMTDDEEYPFQGGSGAVGYDTGSGWDASREGSGGTEYTPRPVGKGRNGPRGAEERGETVPSQPRATHNPNQNTHTYVVNPVKSTNSAVSLRIHTKLFTLLMFLCCGVSSRFLLQICA